jgi:hypothetical protein
MWSIWLCFFPSGEVQVFLWMLRWGNMVLLTTKYGHRTSVRNVICICICRYTLAELLFVPEFHTVPYQYILHQFIFFFIFLTVLYPCFAFKKYIGTSKFLFRAALQNFCFEQSV